MSDNLTNLLHGTANRVPAALHPAAELRRNAQHHQRVRRTGAGILAVFLLAGAIGITAQLGGGKNRAAELPAQQPPVSETSLLIADELDPFFGYERMAADKADTAQGEPETPVTSCQRGTISGLGASDVWHRSFSLSPQNVHDVRARHVTAQFASRDKAANAFDAVSRWFDSCSGLEGSVQRWPAAVAFGGRVQTLQLFRPVPAGAHVDVRDASAIETVSYAMRESAITIVSASVLWSEELIDPVTSENDPMKTTWMFALQRLAGTRTTTENAVPDDFSFVDGPESAPVTEASHYVGERWWFRGCDFLTRRPLDSSRLGFRLVGDVGGAVMQLAIYPDEETARAAAEQLRSTTSDCTSTAQARDQALRAEARWMTETPQIRWITEKGRASADLHVAWRPQEPIPPKSTDATSEEGGFEAAMALAMVQRGTFVLVAAKEATFMESDGQPFGSTVAKDPALDTVQRAIEGNVDAVCKLPNAQCP